MKISYLCNVKKMKTILFALVATLAVGVMGAQEINFINLEANHITMNGADWSVLRRALPRPGDKQATKFHVIQIGDSHIQPGIVTGEVRKKLQGKFGNGGRGLIAPLALAGTNEPSNYLFRSSRGVAGKSRLMSRSWPVENGLTGVAVRLGGGTSLTVRDKNGDPFSSITLMHSPGGFNAAVIDGNEVKAEELSKWSSRFKLPRATAEVTLNNLTAGGAFWGAFLLNDSPGVVVTEIGNNGATYSLYNKINNFGEQLKDVSPNLIILSMGTNEAVGNVEILEPTIDKLIKTIRTANPSVVFLLTTPMEFQKRGGRGYVVNANARRAHEIILDYGKRNKIAVWDLFTIGGGDGSSSKWISARLMNPRDHLHFLPAGYELQGMLLGDALVNALSGGRH